MALVDPRKHFFSEETQRLNNRLPQYHAGRRLRTSNWAQLFSVWLGQSLEDYQVQERRAFANKFLLTANLDELDALVIVQMPQSTDLSPPTESLNLLRNGSFMQRSRPDKVADYWDHAGQAYVNTPAFFGSVSAVLQPGSSQTAEISQAVTRDTWEKNGNRTFSAWYCIDQWTGGTPPAVHSLTVTLTYSDGTTGEFRSAMAAHTSGLWRRVSLTVTPAKDVSQYTVRIGTANVAGFALSVPVNIDAVQAEVGETATSWQANISDVPHWFRRTVLARPLVLDAEHDVFFTDELREFWLEAVPTRASLAEKRDVPSDPSRGGGAGEAIDFHKRSWGFRWDIDTLNGKIRRIGVNPADIYALHDISFFTGLDTGDQYEEDVTGLTYRCVTTNDRWLFAIHEMQNSVGNTIVALSVCDPRIPYPSPDHLESKYTIQLPLVPGIDYHSAVFRFEDPQHLYVGTTTTEFVLRLYYDYAMVDSRSLRVFLRETYDTLALAR